MTGNHRCTREWSEEMEREKGAARREEQEEQEDQQEEEEWERRKVQVHKRASDSPRQVNTSEAMCICWVIVWLNFISCLFFSSSFFRLTSAWREREGKKESKGKKRRNIGTHPLRLLPLNVVYE